MKIKSCNLSREKGCCDYFLYVVVQSIKNHDQYSKNEAVCLLCGCAGPFGVSFAYIMLFMSNVGFEERDYVVYYVLFCIFASQSISNIQ